MVHAAAAAVCWLVGVFFPLFFFPGGEIKDVFRTAGRDSGGRSFIEETKKKWGFVMKQKLKT